jgi:2-oxoglutarate dehydrogenase E2 component (dihydrolipoamide succinyltransferase)
MAKIELIMPKMGESITEATILKWVKNVGDRIELDDTILEIATDKVDSEIPSPVSGILEKILFEENAVVGIGKAIAIISTSAEGEVESAPSTPVVSAAVVQNQTAETPSITVEESKKEVQLKSDSDKFYSPLVKNIAQKENVQLSELDKLDGSGANGRVTKKDILSYVEDKKSNMEPTIQKEIITPAPVKAIAQNPVSASTSISGNVEIVEMDRMRRLIADHMVMSKHTSPHVTSFVEADVTNIVNWREKNKKQFETKYSEKITYTPIFIEAIVKAIRDYPLINVSVDGTNIIIKKDINIGMAAAMPSGNLIVPVIKNADTLNLVGLTKKVNDLAIRARNNQLKPDEIQNGTFTMTNVGTFGNVMGTPIINQPQVAILAVGAIKKKPAVLETPYGDVIAVRQMMFLSLSYDHRVVDGSLGGSFLRKIADYLESFDVSQTI